MFIIRKAILIQTYTARNRKIRVQLFSRTSTSKCSINLNIHSIHQPLHHTNSHSQGRLTKRFKTTINRPRSTAFVVNCSATGDSVAANGHGAATVYHAARISGDKNALLVRTVC